MHNGSWDGQAAQVNIVDGLPDSTMKVWGYLSAPVVDDGDNSYLRLDVRPTRTAASLIISLAVLRRDLDRDARRLLGPGAIVVVEGHHLGTARSACDPLPVPAISGKAGRAFAIMPQDYRIEGSSLEGLDPEVRLYGVLEPQAEALALEGDTVRFVLRPYAVYGGLLPPATPVLYKGDRAAHIYECITTRPHIDVIGSAHASADERYAWRVVAGSVVTGELRPLG